MIPVLCLLTVSSFAAYLLWLQRKEICDLRADNDRLLSRIGYDYQFAFHNSHSHTTAPQPDIIPTAPAFFAMRKPLPPSPRITPISLDEEV